MVSLLVVAALAAPVGFRQADGYAAPTASARTVVAPNELTVVQQTLATRFVAGQQLVDVELPVVVAWMDDWSEQGPGRLVASVRRRTGPDQPHLIGLEIGALPHIDDLAVVTFGSHSLEAQPGWHVVGFVESELEGAGRHVLRGGLGLQEQRWTTSGDGSPMVHARWAWERPRPDGTYGVLEAELVAPDTVPLSFRGLWRIPVGGSVELDLGVQLQASRAKTPSYPQALLAVSWTGEEMPG